MGGDGGMGGGWRLTDSSAPSDSDLLHTSLLTRVTGLRDTLWTVGHPATGGRDSKDNERSTPSLLPIRPPSPITHT